MSCPIKLMLRYVKVMLKHFASYIYYRHVTNNNIHGKFYLH
jgi:hypothetical protein